MFRVCRSLSLVLLLFVVGDVAGCSGSVTPISPTALASSTIPAANLQVVGEQGQWMACLSIGVSFTLLNCDFKGDLHNTGSGCATDVQGTTQFYDGHDQQLGNTYSWSLPAGTIVHPDELISYRSPNVPGDTVNASTRYYTKPTWNNTRCP
jgi:hypothetical protein